MRIGLDFDDVVADSMRTIVDLQNKQYGTLYKLQDVTSFGFENVWGGTKEEWEVKVSGFLSTKYLAALSPVAGAVSGIAALKKRGHELYIVTGRSENYVEATEQWIAEHFPDTFTSVHYGNHVLSGPSERRDKSDICKEYGIEVMIEDYMKNAKECADAGIRVFLFDQPWNQGELSPNMERVKSWDEIVKRLP
jgi:uncharacterized HAD superfamily protein